MWVWLWDDTFNLDAALFVTISDRNTHYDLRFARMDDPGQEEITVVFDGTKYPNFWSTVAKIAGYGGFSVAK